MSNPIYVCSQLAYPELVSTGQTVTELCEALAKEKQAVTIFCAQPSILNQEKTPKIITYKGIRIQRLGSTQFPKLNVIGKLINHLSFALSMWLKLWSLPKNATILLFTNPPILPLLTLAIFKKHHYHLVLFDLYPETLVAAGWMSQNNLLTKVYRHLNHKVYQKMTSVIAIGRCMQEKVQPVAHPKRVSFIPIWCNDEHVKKPLKNVDFRHKWGLEKHFIVGYSGNLAQFHPIETMIEAAIKLKDHPDIAFVFVGEGAKKKQAQYMAKNTSNCHFFSYVEREELPDLLHSFDCGLVGLNSNQTGLSVPSKLMGLLSVGVPIMACCDEEAETVRLIKEHHCGDWVSPKDSDQLAQKIKDLKNDPEKQSVYQANAKQVMVTHYGLESIAKQYLKQLKR